MGVKERAWLEEERVIRERKGRAWERRETRGAGDCMDGDGPHGLARATVVSLAPSSGPHARRNPRPNTQLGRERSGMQGLSRKHPSQMQEPERPTADATRILSPERVGLHGPHAAGRIRD